MILRNCPLDTFGRREECGLRSLVGLRSERRVRKSERESEKEREREKQRERIKRVKSAVVLIIFSDRWGMGRGNVPGRAASALWASLVKLHFVHRPNGPFHVFDSHETFVERQVVSHCVLYKIIHRLNKQRKKRTKPTQSRFRQSAKGGKGSRSFVAVRGACVHVCRCDRMLRRRWRVLDDRVMMTDHADEARMDDDRETEARGC